jgi:hypothetical protein
MVAGAIPDPHGNTLERLICHRRRLNYLGDVSSTIVTIVNIARVWEDFVRKNFSVGPPCKPECDYDREDYRQKQLGNLFHSLK